MQANKATPEVMRDLRQWLEHPTTSANPGFEGARDDLKWLNRQKDLSSIAMGEKAVPESKEKSSAASLKSNGGAAGTGGGGGGFAALFGCAGKRK